MSAPFPEFRLLLGDRVALVEIAGLLSAENRHLEKGRVDLRPKLTHQTIVR